MSLLINYRDYRPHPTCADCSVSTWLYAGQVSLLHELITSAVTKVINKITASFFIKKYYYQIQK